MSEEKNIEGSKKPQAAGDKQETSQQSATEKPGTDNLKPEIASQPQTSNSSAEVLAKADIKPETTDMEVHKHPHHVTHKKKSGEYLLEFFMIFFAVFLGFLAENLREHQIENKREKEYMRSMIDDLKEDTASFKKVIRINLIACNEIDTLIALLKGNNRDVAARRIYYLARLIPLNDMNLVCQNKTFEQLKSSGGFRLIHNIVTENKIGAYYQINKFIETGPTPMQYQNRRDLFLTYDKLFDAEAFQAIIKSESPDSLNINQVRLLSNDPTVINSFCIRYHIMYSTKKIVSEEAKGIIMQATELISYLQKEYHLE